MTVGDTIFWSAIAMIFCAIFMFISMEYDTWTDFRHGFVDWFNTIFTMVFLISAFVFIVSIIYFCIILLTV